MTRKRGRPPSAPELKRTKRVQVNMTESEKAAIKLAADAAGISVSAFILRAGLAWAARSKTLAPVGRRR